MVLPRPPPYFSLDGDLRGRPLEEGDWCWFWTLVMNNGEGGAARAVPLAPDSNSAINLVIRWSVVP